MIISVDTNKDSVEELKAAAKLIEALALERSSSAKQASDSFPPVHHPSSEAISIEQIERVSAPGASRIIEEIKEDAKNNKLLAMKREELRRAAEKELLERAGREESEFDAESTRETTKDSRRSSKDDNSEDEEDYKSTNKEDEDTDRQGPVIPRLPSGVQLY